MTADELLHKFDFLVKFRRANCMVTAFKTFCHVSNVNSLQHLINTCPGPILPGNLSQQTL